MKYTKLFKFEDNYKTFREDGWDYINPLLSTIIGKQKVIYAKKLFPLDLELTPELTYEDEEILLYNFILQGDIIDELFHVLTPLWKLNAEEKQMLQEFGSISSHLSRDISHLNITINGAPLTSLARYYSYESENDEIPTSKSDYFIDNDISLIAETLHKSLNIEGSRLWDFQLRLSSYGILSISLDILKPGVVKFPVELVEGDNGELGINVFNYLWKKYSTINSFIEVEEEFWLNLTSLGIGGVTSNTIGPEPDGFCLYATGGSKWVLGADGYLAFKGEPV